MLTQLARSLTVIFCLIGLNPAAWAQSPSPVNNQTVAILKNTYKDVYGTGLHQRFGGGYMLEENSALRVTFSLQSLDADLVPMGDLGVSNLYGQYDDYQSFGIDLGYRRNVPVEGSIRTGFRL